MMKRLTTLDPAFDRELDALLKWEARESPEVARIAAEIVADVRANGDEALVRLSARYDGLELACAGDMELGAPDLQRSLASLPTLDRDALTTAADRIRSYHERQPRGDFEYTDDLGNRLGQRTTPLDRVGVYVPGGQAAYPSTVLMTVVPARVAGSSRGRRDRAHAERRTQRPRIGRDGDCGRRSGVHRWRRAGHRGARLRHADGAPGR